MTKKDDKKIEGEYRENLGRDPRNLSDDHPDRWQWEYRGTKAERDELAERLGLRVEADEPPSQDEALF